jgi:glutathione S-transferase
MSTPPRLVIGQKRYSSWSLRPWILLKHADFAFTEVSVAVEGIGFNAKLLHLSPSGLVPILHLDDGSGDTVWDSLAIAEFANERVAPGVVWPVDPRARTLARAISAEMHSGFGDVRAQLSFNLGFRLTKAPEFNERVNAQLARIISLWSDARARFGEPSNEGPFLFGRFCAADAMFAPVVFRFFTYRVAVADARAAAYYEAMLAHPLMIMWRKEALVETAGRVEKYDAHLTSLGGVPETSE